jgi:predicted GTPase
MQDQCILVINKVDKWMSESDKDIATAPYRELGLANTMMLSAKNGANYDELEEILYMTAKSQTYKKYDPKHELIVSFV